MYVCMYVYTIHKIPHPRFYANAKNEGQIAPLCKRDKVSSSIHIEGRNNDDNDNSNDKDYYTSTYSGGNDVNSDSNNAAMVDDHIPHGLCKINSNDGN